MNRYSHSAQAGAALVVVLILLVLLLGVVLAFFSQSILQQNISKNSANQTAVELFARGAMTSLIGDLRQEIVDGSTVNSDSMVKIYRPTSPKFAVPGLGVPNLTPATIIGSGMENLVKISRRGENFSGSNQNGGLARASQISTMEPSTNGRSISLERWNMPRLLNGSGSDGLTPPNKFTAPDWILVGRDGSNPLTGIRWSPKVDSDHRDVVIGRYAYAIYNEGGLLDVNSAGYPAVVVNKSPQKSAQIVNQTAYKSSLAYADLTQLPGLEDQSLVDKLIYWRNHSSLSSDDPSGSFLKFATGYPNKFLSAFTPTGSSTSDRGFVSRQQLIKFFTSSAQVGGGETLKSLPYLGTFSRYLNQPSCWPDPLRPKVPKGPASGDGTSYEGGNNSSGEEDSFNPIFGALRVTKAFDRNDGSKANPGEPLVKNRFPLDRLLWLTYKGPSAKVPREDALFKQYERLGISDSEVSSLRLGGTPENIEKFFGLRWNESGAFWTYFQGSDSDVLTLAEVLQAEREPNFFEMLQAAINVGSIAKSYGDGARGNAAPYTCTTDSYVVWQILQMGANIIDGANPTQYPTQIRFGATSNSAEHKIFGSMDLPYFYAYRYVPIVNQWATPAPPPNRSDPTPLPGTVSDPGKVIFLVVPMVWNPYVEEALQVPIPAELVPKSFRICAVNQTPGGITATPPQPQTMCRYGSNSTIFGPLHTSVQPWTETNTALTFDNDYAFSKTPSSLYREPTILFRPNFPTGSHLKMESGQGFTEVNSGSERFIGFYLDTFDESWTSSGKIAIANSFKINLQSAGFTIRLLYQSTDSQWLPYQEVFSPGDANDNIGVPDRASSSLDALTDAALLWPSTQATYPNNRWDAFTISTWKGVWPSRSLWDPRTGRWGTAGGVYPTSADPLFRVIDSDLATVQSLRPTSRLGDGMQDIGNYEKKGFSSGNRFGGVSQNLNGSPQLHYKDPDGVIRRAMGGALGQCAANASDDNGLPSLGLPLASTKAFAGYPNSPAYTPDANQKLSRPAILHRPYRSVGELAYVFRGTPWKNIDFAFPESGDSALLDVFCIHSGEASEPLAAGRVDLNTRQIPILKALLAGAARTESGISQTNALSGIDSLLAKGDGSDSDKIARALVARTTSTDPAKGPLINIGDLVGRYVGGAHANLAPYDGFSADLLGLYNGGSSAAQNVISRYRETAIRALSDTGMTGTWNLMVDLIAQTGRYTANGFLVEGEKRYWVHLAIDRQTAKVIDQQVEEVSE